jgi:hypothetical protein
MVIKQIFFEFKKLVQVLLKKYWENYSDYYFHGLEKIMNYKK